jgi:hypothetical protein
VPGHLKGEFEIDQELATVTCSRVDFETAVNFDEIGIELDDVDIDTADTKNMRMCAQATYS